MSATEPTVPVADLAEILATWTETHDTLYDAIAEILASARGIAGREQEEGIRGWRCGCTFDPDSIHPKFSAAWYRAHRDRHLEDFPDADDVTRDNFDMFIEQATRKESTR